MIRMLSIARTHSKKHGRLQMYVSVPVIYGMVVPIAFLDVSVQLYQAICFRLYGIEPVSRAKYVRLGHRGRGMIRRMDRLHCAYCGYANGVMGYARAVVAETEKYWCPIRHEGLKNFVAPPHHKDFVPDGDAAVLQERLEKMR